MKTAVILFGHLRTWNLCKDHLIKSMNEIYGPDLHWFISLWDTSTASAEDVKLFFAENSQEVLGFRMVDPNDSPLANLVLRKDWSGIPMGVIGPGYLRQLASRDKRMHELKNGAIYDRVIFTRPDVIYYYDKDTISNEEIIVDEKDFPMQIRGDFDDTALPIASPSAHDVFPVAGSLSSDLFGFMFLGANSDFDTSKRINIRRGCIHAWVSMYCSKHIISVDNRWLHREWKRNIWPKVIRPTTPDLDTIYDEHDKWDGEFFSPNWHDRMWNNDPDYYYRKKYCKQLGIDFRDYGLDER